jgi:hypothetical protein
MCKHLYFKKQNHCTVKPINTQRLEFRMKDFYGYLGRWYVLDILDPG